MGKPLPYGPRIPTVWFSFRPNSVSVTDPVFLMQNSMSPGRDGVDDMENGASPSPRTEPIMNCPGR
jgi:hypothetical protein